MLPGTGQTYLRQYFMAWCPSSYQFMFFFYVRYLYFIRLCLQNDNTTKYIACRDCKHNITILLKGCHAKTHISYTNGFCVVSAWQFHSQSIGVWKVIIAQGSMQWYKTQSLPESYQHLILASYVNKILHKWILGLLGLTTVYREI